MAETTVNDNEDKTKKSDELKAKANELFKQDKFSPAIELYSEAIDLCPTNAVLYANRWENAKKAKVLEKKHIFIFADPLPIWG